MKCVINIFLLVNIFTRTWDLRTQNPSSNCESEIESSSWHVHPARQPLCDWVIGSFLSQGCFDFQPGISIYFHSSWAKKVEGKGVTEWQEREREKNYLAGELESEPGMPGAMREKRELEKEKENKRERWKERESLGHWQRSVSLDWTSAWKFWCISLSLKKNPPEFRSINFSARKNRILNFVSCTYFGFCSSATSYAICWRYWLWFIWLPPPLLLSWFTALFDWEWWLIVDAFNMRSKHS